MMQKIALVLALLIGLSLATPAAARYAAQEDIATPGDHALTLKHDDFDRKTLVHIPKKYDGKNALPLLLFLHGAGGSSDNSDKQTSWSGKADLETFIVAYPDALPVNPKRDANFVVNPNLWNDESDRGNRLRGEIDDLGFLDQLMDELVSHLKIDTERVYVTGFSNGASMAFSMGARLSVRITAIAPVSGEFYAVKNQTLSEVKLSHPIPMLFIIGDADPLNPQAGGTVRTPWGTSEEKAKVIETVNGWATVLNCPAAPLSKTLKPKVTMKYWTPCDGGSEVRYVLITDMGHAWPGGRNFLPERIVGKPSNVVDATDLIWTFFNQYSKKLAK